MKRIPIITTLIALLVITSGLVVYGMLNPHTPTKQLKVAATFFPIAELVRNVAGDTVEVVQILPTGDSPHTFDPTPGDIQKLEGAQLIFKNGLGIDDWINELATSSTSNSPVVELSKDIPVLCNEQHTLEDKAESSEEEPCNPHIWLSLRNAQLMLDTITQQLSTTFPDQANIFQQNANEYKTKLSVLDNEIQQKFIDKKNRSIITFHDAFSYFAKDYNLTVAATIEPFPGKQPSPKYIDAVIQTIKNLGVSAIFREPQLSDDVVAAVAADLNLTIRVLDPEGSKENATYIDMMRANADTIAASL